MTTEEISWRKSSYSNGDTNCIEVSTIGNAVLLRESDTPATILKTSRDQLRVFTLGIKAGELDHFAPQSH
ncbi:DUF397 domain-containing protein [Streptomyces sparsogenes]|uniref:DUF397 domain-containing protein n=1 Tax=Streptomyces sparsogenes TaxID=67365 RepID=UPI0033F99D86